MYDRWFWNWKRFYRRWNFVYLSIEIIHYWSKSQSPRKLADDNLVEIDVSVLAKALGISMFKIRMKSNFNNKKRENTVSDDPTVISQEGNFFEISENSTQGDPVRNIVNVDRQYLRKPIIIIVRNFVEQFHIKFVSISTVQN